MTTWLDYPTTGDPPPDSASEVFDYLRSLRPAWMDQAACRGAATDLFFSTDNSTHVEAMSICRTCSVTTECLDRAMERPGTAGIWAGMSGRERHRLGG